ncbi:MAG: helix-turn-helix domain-containing protein [Lachnospiraceae bacterium]|nr:helix-turn-helix domain-containing protein [Lachnospiraceae bacterium]
MGEVRYMISEASKKVDVEAHVLRYWEEELELPIERTEMGHRYYTEDDIRLFHCIKRLKEQGMFLKELKEVIPDLLKTKKGLEQKAVQDQTTENLNEDTKIEKTPEAVTQVENLISSIMKETLLENNEVLRQKVGEYVSEKVIKEMDYLFQAKERQEEERYQKLDCLIRQQQMLRKETAKSFAARRLRKLFGTSLT